MRGSEGECAIDISKLRAQTGLITLDYGFVNTGSTESAITFVDGEVGILRYRGYDIDDLAETEHPSFLETAWLLIYGELPTQAAARRVQPPDPQAHAAARGREALLRRVPEGRAPDGDARVGGQRARDLLPNQRRPARSRARAAVDHPAARQAPDGRGLLVQEVDRPAVPLPRQLARPHRELPAHDVRGARRAVRGEPDDRARAQAAAHPARRPRAELLDVDGAHGRFVRREHLRVDRGRGRRALGTAARRREPGRDRDARIHPRRRRRRAGAVARAKDPDDDFRLSGFGHRVYKNYDPRARILRNTAERVLADLGSSDSLFDIALELEQVALTDEYFIEKKLYPNVDFYSGLIYRAMGFPTTMFPVLFAIGRLPGWLAHWKEAHEKGPSKIGRPRQIYTGATERKYVPLDQRT